MTFSSAMARALKAKYRTPQALMRHLNLGLDAAELNDAGEHDKDNDLAGLIDWCANQGGMSGELVAELSQRLENLVHRSRLEGQRRLEAASDDDPLALFKQKLKAAGFSDDEISEAIRIAGAKDESEKWMTSQEKQEDENRRKAAAAYPAMDAFLTGLPRDLGGRGAPPPKVSASKVSANLGMDTAQTDRFRKNFPGAADIRVI
jgi:DNA-binding transcriptional MerR regulator